jgi:hypothetical protein
MSKGVDIRDNLTPYIKFTAIYNDFAPIPGSWKA